MNDLDKEKLIEKDIKAVENRIRHAFNQGYEMGLKHGKEQEPKTERIEYGTDGNSYKLTISNGKEFEQESIDDVLDAIKAEVDRQYKWLINTEYTIRDVDIAFGSIFRTIEKYRKENKE